ncbi:MAG: substrate-binding domain-containing protein [Clostridia bacterium]|nr:substrate-binding domain-containing protein [Clostridia bacterium]
MKFHKENNRQNELIQKMNHFDYVDPYEEVDEYSKLYNTYQTYFAQYQTDFGKVMHASRQLKDLVESVVETSARVRQTAGFIDKGASAQAEDAEHCIKIIADFSERMNDMQEVSVQLVEMAHQMGQENESGREAIKLLEEKQKKEQDVMTSLADEIRAVHDKMNQINQVTAVLYKIAAQTNLLALNASIEAARAGEAGKGFAVVAEEVRALSEQSRSASENINGSVKDIEKELETLIATLNSSEEIFSDQQETVKTVTGVMETISGKVDEFVTEQQSFGRQVQLLGEEKNKMLSSISNISAVTEEFAAMTEEVSNQTMGQEHTLGLLNEMTVTLNKYLQKIKDSNKGFKMDSVDTQQKKVAFFCEIDNPFWQTVIKEAEKTAKILDYDLHVYAPKTRDSQVAVDMMQEIVDSKYDGLVISLIKDEKIYELLRKAANNGMKIVFLQAKVPQVPCEGFIGTDPIRFGEKSAESIINLVGADKTTVAMCVWTDVKQEVFEKRVMGFENGISKAPNIKLHKFMGANAPTQAEADRFIEQALTDCPEISICYSYSSTWATLYANYLERHPGRFKLVTVDFMPVIEKYIRSGIIECTIAQRQFLWGSAPFEILSAAFNGQTGNQDFQDTGSYEINLKNIDVFSK